VEFSHQGMDMFVVGCEKLQKETFKFLFFKVTKSAKGHF
jgi:hypothetical protein